MAAEEEIKKVWLLPPFEREMKMMMKEKNLDKIFCTKHDIMRLDGRKFWIHKEVLICYWYGLVEMTIMKIKCWSSLDIEFHFDVQHEFCHQVFLSSWFDFIYERFQKSKFNWRTAWPGWRKHTRIILCIVYISINHFITHRDCIQVGCFMPVVFTNILFRQSTQLTDQNKLFKS